MSTLVSAELLIKSGFTAENKLVYHKNYSNEDTEFNESYPGDVLIYYNYPMCINTNGKLAAVIVYNEDSSVRGSLDFSTMEELELFLKLCNNDEDSENIHKCLTSEQ